MQYKKNNSLVSIIMAAYNAEKTIRSAIQSVLDQTYQDWELIVVNDCSKDNTLSIVQSFTDHRIKIFSNRHNMGVSLTRKEGLNAARGNWIAILDSDDMWTSDKLDKQMRYARKESAELIFTGSAFMNEVGDRVGWQLHVPKRITYRELLKQNLISDSSVLVRKELFKKYYVVGDNMHEDFAMWLKITRDGYVAHGIDEPLLIYRLSGSSKSGDKFRSAKMNWNTYRFLGLNLAESFYYMCFYMINGIKKYKHFI